MFSLADARRAPLEVDGVQALGVIDGRLVYSRADGSLMAVPFDAQAMRVTGSPTQLRDRVASSYVGTAVTLSEGGTLVYRPAGTYAQRLVLVDAQGRVRPLGGQVGSFLRPRFSPDGRRIAVAILAGFETAARGATGDLWMFDRESGEGTRLTRTGTASSPDWAPDGKRLIYISGTPPSRREVWTLAIDGSVEPRRLVEIEGDVLEVVMAPDGRSLVAVRRGSGPETNELVRVSLDGSPSASPLVAVPLPNAARRPVQPRISRDGRWVAFEDAATWEVHVRSLDGAGAIQVTDREGSTPTWGADSRRLYYSTGQGWAVAELETAPTLAVAARRSLGEFTFLTEDYDLAPDGQTFVVVSPADGGADALVAVHWADALRQSWRGRE
jgi:dipeptidyl aminopeptidase/acylaminoacyl peptidase